MENDTQIRDTLARTGGLLLVDKPTGMTSHDVVAAIRKLVRPLRVGHTGTLDPIASGLLVLCVGDATKFAGFIEARYKLYRAVALLGTKTDTQDIAGKVIVQVPVEGITGDRIRDAARSFVGMIEQTPPAFSAVKVGGVRAYKLARRQQSVQLKPRSVEVRRFEIERVRLPRVDFTVECSKGTYVRTLCNDLGGLLGVGGCMESLRRLAVGRFDVADARPLAELETRESVTEALAPVSQALSHLPAVECTTEQARRLSHGMAVPIGDDADFSGTEGSWAQALGPGGELLAVGKCSRDGETVLFHPKRVLANNGGA
jgi:tRNA pseudouridine55 synthase